MLITPVPFRTKHKLLASLGNHLYKRNKSLTLQGKTAAEGNQIIRNHIALMEKMKKTQHSSFPFSEGKMSLVRICF